MKCQATETREPISDIAQKCRYAHIYYCIEAKASGSCLVTDSTFAVKVEDAGPQTIIGHVAFDDPGQNWTHKNDNEDVMDVYCNNSGDQARITVTVEAS